MTLKNNKKMVKKTKSKAVTQRKFPDTPKLTDTPKLPGTYKKIAFKARMGQVDLTFDQPEELPHAAMDEIRRRLAGVSRAFDTLKVEHDRLLTRNLKLNSENKALKKEQQELRAKASESDDLREKLKDQHDRNNCLHGTLYTERKTIANLQAKLGKKEKVKK
ncbi:hypothetical protein A4X13_0g2412 [Tilletia indica]|uniref:Uncharacterized protein n=1 Tax=Tilletia indica TaxID=43049 RepID=A0A177TTQ7_9BASI|nr:hypothetical protein A4X13_0g2412 [Tilletia indica]